MTNNKMKRIMSAVLAAALMTQPVLSPIMERTMLTAYAAQWDGYIKADRVNVRSGAGTGYSAVAVLVTNTKISVQSETRGADGMTWYQITWDGGAKSGYVRSDYVRQAVTYSASDSSFEQWMNEQGFPESYKNDLRGLHQQYPNWIFKAQKTGLDWNTVISEESKVGRNLVDKNSKSSWKSIADGAFDWAANSWPGFDGSAWNAASSEIISHYMDPRNFLSEPYIFQFELQSYDPSVQTRDGLVKLVEGTFLAGDAIVPLNGSQIEGGTIVDGAVQAVGGASGGTSGNSASGSAQEVGPGIGPGSSNDASYGPGANLGSGGTADLVGPGVSAFSLSSAANAVFGALGGLTSYAGVWQKESDAPLRWVYKNDDGTLLANGWYWLDGNNDGVSECYYFYADGAMAYNTTVDGYQVDGDGRWIDASGAVQTKQSGMAAVSGEQMKRVPYVDIIMKAAQESGVSPYVLASMILQEQGKGTSDSISGTNASYPGYYNYYNLGAYAHDGMGAIEAGLQYASQSGSGDRPWNTIERSIIGGAKAYGESYVSVGQDTFYLKKFNVQGSNKYSHQYMTNVPAAAAEGAKISAAYNSDIKATALEFKIPVYENMPETPCPMPTLDGSPNNKLSSITVDGYSITPTFYMNTTDYSLIVESGVSSITVNAQAIDQTASVSGTGTVSLNTGLNEIIIRVTAGNGTTRDYKLSVSRKQGEAADTAGGMTPGGTGESNVSYGPGAAETEQNSSTQTEQTGGPGAGTVIIGGGPGA